MKDQAQADHLARWDTALAAGEANESAPGITDILVQLGAAATGAKNCPAGLAEVPTAAEFP